ncbi:MAG: tetratricopeptide repeat protein [Acidobacteriota bacterium]|nr:tetratricopeptide repeat protein [Acidobacteriota bacterium]
MSGRRLPILPLLVGALLGFIGGYFAAGGGRPSASSPGAETSGGGERGRLDELQKAVERDPENPELLTALGNAWFDREEWDRAIAAYEKARRKAPENPNLLSDLGAAYRNRGKLARAVSLFERARKSDPNHWQSLLNLVLIHAYDLKDPAGAQRWFEELKRRYPEIPDLDRIQARISGLRTS